MYTQKLKAKLLFLVTLACLSTQAFAGAWTGYRNIVSLESGPTGTEVRLSGHSGACTQDVNNQTWAKVTTSTANKEQLLPLLLMAFATGLPINIYCESSTPWAPLNNIIVQRQ